METYKNSYAKDEDNVLWELHEIRHQLHKRKKGKTLEEINSAALQKFAEWQKERNSRQQKGRT